MLPSTAIKILADIECGGLNCGQCPLNMENYITDESTEKSPFCSLCLSAAFHKLIRSPKKYLEENGMPSYKALDDLNRPAPWKRT